MAFLFNDAVFDGLRVLTAAVAVPFSVSALIEADAFVGAAIFGIGESGSSNRFHQLEISSGGVLEAIGRRGGQSTATHPTTLSVNTPYQVGGRFNTTNREPVLDGVIGNQNTTSRAPAPNSTTIGVQAGSFGDDKNFSGLIQEVGVWNIQLSDADFAQLGHRVSPLLVRPEALVFYLPCFNVDYLDKVGGLLMAGYNSTPSVADHQHVFNPVGARYVA